MATLGVGCMLVAAIGIVRFADSFTRLHCAGKSATLGVACTLLAAALWSTDPGVALRALLAALFFLLTGPIACHALARAIWRTRCSAWTSNAQDA
ncbi:MAG: monovalent cation/H(+) antiporter subunit G, partial [Planctomycetes bacterium]|nr:monovalent cation/H(+) antiporter subunit G [Planctomycetota bacterium]